MSSDRLKRHKISGNSSHLNLGQTAAEQRSDAPSCTSTSGATFQIGANPHAVEPALPRTVNSGRVEIYLVALTVAGQDISPDLWYEYTLHSVGSHIHTCSQFDRHWKKHRPRPGIHGIRWVLTDAFYVRERYGFLYGYSYEVLHPIPDRALLNGSSKIMCIPYD